MKITINRRDFLRGLAGLGATVLLPEQPTSDQIDVEWRRLNTDPWFFEVNNHGTILEDEQDEPQLRSDIYDIVVDAIRTPDALVQEVEVYDELTQHFIQLAETAAEDVEFELSSDDIAPKRKRELLRLQSILEDPEYGWGDWVRVEGQSRLVEFREEIRLWLDDPLDWMQMEAWPKRWSAQGKALSFFEGLGSDLLQEVGIVIVEGEHPGSTYFAAELRAAVDDANEAAQRLELPFRFKEVDA